MKYKKSAHFFWHQNLKLKSLILYVFQRKKLSKMHTSKLQSTQKVIEKVRFHTKDADLNSSITEKKLIFLLSKSEAKILNFACFLAWKIEQKTLV